MQRLTERLVAVAAIGFACLISGMAVADEQLEPLASSGDWMAAQHVASLTTPPDVCVALTTAISGDESQTRGFALRWSAEDTEMRYSNSACSLPAGATGLLTLDVGSFQLSIPSITYNYDTITTVLTQKQLQALISAMDNVSFKNITVGNQPAARVSLNGSNQATTAFLTRAGLNASGEGGGVNPFR